MNEKYASVPALKYPQALNHNIALENVPLVPLVAMFIVLPHSVLLR